MTLWRVLGVCDTFLVRLTYWSVTQDILLNSRMTNSPTVSVVGILMVNTSGLLFHILSNSISSLGMSVVYLFTSVSVMGRSISCVTTVFSRIYTEQRLKTSGNSSSRIVQSVCISESYSHVCCMCPKVWIGRSSSVLNLPSTMHRSLQRSYLFDSFVFVILCHQ